MKIVEIREKGIPELEKTLAEKQSSQRKMRFDIATKQVKNNREYRKIKRDIAKTLTVLKEKAKQ
jgi:large subunit ribosomal protein L29